MTFALYCFLFFFVLVCVHCNPWGENDPVPCWDDRWMLPPLDALRYCEYPASSPTVSALQMSNSPQLLWFENSTARTPTFRGGDCDRMFGQQFVGSVIGRMNAKGWRQCLNQLRKFNPDGNANYRFTSPSAEGVCEFVDAVSDAKEYVEGAIALSSNYVVHQCTTCNVKVNFAMNIGCGLVPESCSPGAPSVSGASVNGFEVVVEPMLGDVCPKLTVSQNSPRCVIDGLLQSDLADFCRDIPVTTPSTTTTTATTTSTTSSTT